MAVKSRPPAAPNAPPPAGSSTRLSEGRMLTGRVIHQRLSPTRHRLDYPLACVALPLYWLDRPDRAHNPPLAIERRGAISMWRRDYGPRDGSALGDWIANILRDHGIEQPCEVMLVTMPRIWGHSFNPVNFWLCYQREEMDKPSESLADHRQIPPLSQRKLRAILCEVNNTFGETHSYFCAHDDRRPILPGDQLQTDKLFHVSPFLPRNGHYRFRFNVDDAGLAIAINYHNANGQLQLATMMRGQWQPLSRKRIWQSFLLRPPAEWTVLFRIHLNALKLYFKKIRFYKKPLQIFPNISVTVNRGMSRQARDQDQNNDQHQNDDNDPLDDNERFTLHNGREMIEEDT